MPVTAYKAANPVAQETVTAQQQIDTNMSPDEWMKKILSSEDSGMSMNPNGDPVIEMAMTLFTSSDRDGHDSFHLTDDIGNPD